MKNSVLGITDSLDLYFLQSMWAMVLFLLVLVHILKTSCFKFLGYPPYLNGAMAQMDCRKYNSNRYKIPTNELFMPESHVSQALSFLGYPHVF